MMPRPHPSYRAGAHGGVTGADAGGVLATRRGAGPTLLTEGRVVALHRGNVVGAGAILERGLVEGTRLVSAESPDGRTWWVPARAVWSDGESTSSPQHPCPVGLATATDPTAATLQGLSDRLGWEAVLHLERGHELPPVPDDVGLDAGPFVLLDGRLGHGVPTVVVIGEELTRWGAAMTWDGALHRALYGVQGLVAEPVELAAMIAALSELGLHPVTVDLGTPRLRQLGICRCSVQLLAAS